MNFRGERKMCKVDHKAGVRVVKIVWDCIAWIGISAWLWSTNRNE